jgi:quinol monooxygenase YgiN
MKQSNVTHPSAERFVAVAHLHIKLPCLERFLSELRAVLPLSAAEDGLLRYEWLQDRTDPTRFTFVDLFRDEAAYQAHLATPHMKHFGNAVADYFASPPVAEACLIKEIFNRADAS